MDSIRLYDVTPRDGLQNEPEIVNTSDKVSLIMSLVEAGYKDIEVTSFVRPSWIPQLADGGDVLRQLPEAPDGVRFWSLIPNRRGLELALSAGVKHIATFMSASESHNRKNLNRTQQESLKNLETVMGIAKDDNLSIRAYLSTVFGCPYEGPVSIERSVEIAVQLVQMGADEIALGDTTGMANPNLVTDVVQAMDDAGVPLSKIALHMHDTRGTGLTNILAGYQAGIRTFDGSTGGVGGCPYAPGASGNVATEDIVNLFECMGVRTNINLDQAVKTAELLSTVLGRELPGRYYRYHLGSQRRAKRNTA
jgi:hydroxymethylglutaryl-CoA lyase